MKKGMIMVVDDNHCFVAEIEEVLRLSGFTTIAIHDGRMAMETAQVEKPDLILLDFMLGDGVHGFQVADLLRRSPSTSGIPLIGMSAFLSEEYEGMLKNMYGFRSYLQKPFKPKTLITAIETVLKAKRSGPNVKHPHESGNGN